MYLKLSGNTDLGGMQQIIRITQQGHGFEKKTRLAGGEFFFQNTVHSGCFARFAMGSRKHVSDRISRCPGRFLGPLGTILKSVDRLWGVLVRTRQRLGVLWCFVACCGVCRTVQKQREKQVDTYKPKRSRDSKSLNRFAPVLNTGRFPRYWHRKSGLRKICGSFWGTACNTTSTQLGRLAF